MSENPGSENPRSEHAKSEHPGQPITVLEPGADADRLVQALSNDQTWLVACLCAAWCGTCTSYQTEFGRLAEKYPQHVFAWVDIEDHPDLLDDEDIENFPTLLVQSPQATLFYGTMLPHIGHLDRLLTSLADTPPTASVPGPALRAALARSS